MSLKLRQSIPGRPLQASPSPLAPVITENGVFYAYPSSTAVVLITPAGELTETLPFWDALPHRAGPSEGRGVGGVVARSGMMVAWSGEHVVLWHRQTEWSVHSTIMASTPIASIDYVDGLLALGTRAGIELWRTDPAADVIVWDRVWERRTAADPLVALPSARSHVAWYRKDTRTISVQSLDRKWAGVGDPQDISQPRQVEWIGWRASSSGDAQLYVIASNAVLRIYSPVLDDPIWFQLLYSIDHRAFHNPVHKGPSSGFGSLWVPDGDTIRAAAKAALAKEGGGYPPKIAKVLEGIDAEEMDLVLWFGADDEVAIRAILNLDRKPPTLIQSEPVAFLDAEVGADWSSQGVILLGSPLHIGFPPSSTNLDISSLCLELTDLLAGSSEALSLATSPVDFETMSVLMKQDIDSFARTPNGRGLLAIGAQGEIGVWEKRKVGKSREGDQKRVALVGKGQWQAPVTPCLYSIYAKGRGIASYYKGPDGPRVVLQHLDPGDGRATEEVVMPQFNPKEGDDIKMLMALSDIDDGYSARKRRTRRAVIMAVAASGEAWVWRVDPSPGSPHRELSQSVLLPATPTRLRTESPGGSPQHRTVRLADSVYDSPPKGHSRLAESPSGSPVRGTSVSGSSFIYRSEKPIITLISHSILPLEDGKKPHLVLPVDPMGWHQSTVDWETDTPLQDMVVTVSDSGVLEFWTPRLGQHLPGYRRGTVYGDMANHAPSVSAAWTRTGVVRTEKKNVVLARCSSRKKTVLVTQEADGSHEMSIWDSNVSEFSTGLELSHNFGTAAQIQDLDWTTTADLQSVLAVGFSHHLVLVCEQRMSYIEVTPGWAPFIHIDMRKYTSVPISDSIWIAGGTLAVGAGNQIYVFSRFLELTPEEEEDEEEPEDIFELIAHENGPLFDFHPTMLSQCLLWDKIDLVKRILCTLLKDLRKCEMEGKRRLVYQRLDPLDFHTPKAQSTQVTKKTATDYSSLFAVTPTDFTEDQDDFSAAVVNELIERLDGVVAVPLNQNEKTTLAALVQATFEVEQSRRSLDICGLRYLISIRTFANRDRRGAAISGAATPSANGHLPGIASYLEQSGLPLPAPPHLKISFRNIVWATHSESHEVLLQAAAASCENGKLNWREAKRLGICLWLKSQDSIRAQLEIIARNRFMADEERDPTKCSLLFFALGKKQVVHGLWRQAPGHKEQSMMLKFLANDFTTDRWKTAAAKNAYALLSKQRYEYAAAFFMLAGDPKSAITVCLRQLNDWQLGVALARAVEGDGPLLRWILTDTVLPMAFGGGHRWLASWALWMVNRRDLSVRVLVSPMEEVLAAWNERAEKPIATVGNPDNDDPSLLLLFQFLKGKTLQTAKGTSEVAPKLEFDFVLHNARVFFRMGCHPLGLDLLRSWSFDRPFFPPPKRRAPSITIMAPGSRETSPVRTKSSPLYPQRTVRRRTSFMLSNPTARENMLMDLDPLEEGDDTEPPTRATSPPPDATAASPPAVGKPNQLFSGNDLFAGFNLGASSEHAIVDTPEVSPGDSRVVSWQDTPEKPSTPAVVTSPRAVTPPPPPPAAAKPSDSPVDEQPRKVGNFMKDLRNDVKQGAMEFDMDSFFGGGAPAPPAPPAASAAAPGPPAPEKETPAPPAAEEPPRKVGNLMKDMRNDVKQGGMEFDMDNFFGGAPAAPAPAPAPAAAPAAAPEAVETATPATPSAPATPATPAPEESKAADGATSDAKPASPAAAAESKDEDAKDAKAAQAEEPEEPRKVGNLMKDLKHDVQQGATEFNMDNFF